MKIAVAQLNPLKGELLKNIEKHQLLVDLAHKNGSKAVFFPELSITGYEPEIANKFAVSPTDKLFDSFDKISSDKQITIGIGVPTRSENGIKISMLIFSPDSERSLYSKQYLHEDELPYFVSEEAPFSLTLNDIKIAPAICYESLLDRHIEKIADKGIDIYLASVAKPQRGIEKAYQHYPKIAQKYGVPVLISNSTGYCDNFLSAGQSAVWNKKGELLIKMDSTSEGIIVFGIDSEEVLLKELLPH